MAMGKRDLLFLGVILGGAAALRGSLVPSRPAVEKVEASVDDVKAVVAAVDAEFRGRWAEQKWTPAPRAPELAVIRRIALGLTGTIPSLAEIRRFEAGPTGDRPARWLERTLRGRRSADYLAERLARAFVGTEDGPFLVYRRRRFVAWLSDELLKNRPYDAVVRELIAGEGLWTDRPATNFVTVTYDQEKKEPDPERLAGRVARAFLGVRLDCAQCHDHPFQPWKQADFRGLAAFFAQAHSGLGGIRDGAGEFRPTDRKTGAQIVAAPGVPFHPELLPEAGPRHMRLARWVTDPRNPSLARATANRAWALLFGRPLVEPVDDLPAAGDPPRALVLLADDFAAHGFDLRRLFRVIAATEAFRLDSIAAPDPVSASTPAPADAAESAWAAFPMTRLRPGQVAGAVLQSASLATIDAGSHILVRLATYGGVNEFVRRHGDSGEDESANRGGTIPQRLLMMNGDLVQSKTRDDLLQNAATRIAVLAPTDRSAVEAAYLAALTRRPTPEEADHFARRLAGTTGQARKDRLTDLCWTLLNATEFSWNH